MNISIYSIYWWLPVLIAESGRIDFIEENRGLLLPLLALLVIVLLTAAVILAWKTPEIAGAEKARLKGELIRSIRGHIGWMTAQEAADKLGVKTNTAAQLMDELQKEGVLVKGIMQGHIHYRIKSL